MIPASYPPAAPAQTRVPCPACGALILRGARKCKACRSWLVAPPQSRGLPKGYRGLTLIGAAVVAVAAVLISQRDTPVGDAPPLTPITEGSAVVSAAVPAGDRGVRAGSGQPAAKATPDGAAASPAAAGGEVRWRTRTISIDVHPLDLLFHPSGRSVYVSGNDATLWEYDVRTGKVLHMATMPAQGDRLRLLANRYLAIIRHVDAGHIPVLDTQHWERDPTLLYVGANPADILALPDGKTAVSASSRGKRLSWFELGSGRRLGDIRVPHATRHLFLLRAGDRPYVGAMGRLVRAGDPVGAWIDIFDPAETPFGATRRSIAVGREPSPGVSIEGGKALFFADRASNSAGLLRIAEATETVTVPVGQSPEVALVMGEERYGLTVNSQARTATVLRLPRMERAATLMLAGAPRTGVTDPGGTVAFVSLGGTAWPPTGTGVAVIAGDPPKVIASFETDKGANRAASSADGSIGAVANYWGKSITLVERARSDEGS
ncbi:MAG: hypothetical protein JRI23_07970 [Deltaproteobacteria bacterium]|nr:hypothetical protein [Deltaproteobacteria bacterium]MBW2531548.1 hypothetical protein [Deltaproteobacteria bacterium]